MKRIATILLCAVFGCGTGLADELHRFTSADGSKSFRGTLMEFDSNSNSVKVLHQQGKVMSFKMSLLSGKDQEYIKERAPILAAVKGLRIDTDMNRKTGTTRAAGDWLCETALYSYDVMLENTLTEAIEGVEFEYSIFIERERRNVENRTEVVSGSHSISTFLGYGDENFTTTEVTLENWSDNPPIPSGGGGG